MPWAVLCLLLLQLGDVNTVVMVVAAAVIIFLLFGGWMALKAHRTQPTTGREGIIGRTGAAIVDLSPDGQVEIAGEIWRAVAVGDRIPKDARVVVIDEKGLTLYVREA